jgi:hypothetical protein
LIKKNSIKVKVKDKINKYLIAKNRTSKRLDNFKVLTSYNLLLEKIIKENRWNKKFLIYGNKHLRTQNKYKTNKYTALCK